MNVSPCAEASKASMDCMNHHDYDRDKCLGYFQAYRDCKKTWVSPANGTEGRCARREADAVPLVLCSSSRSS